MPSRSLRITILMLISALTGALAFLNLSVYYTIGIQKETAAYPFGGEGPVPYYYQSPELYAQVSLVWVCVFTLLSVIALIAIRKGGIQLKSWLTGIMLALVLSFILQGLVPS